MDLGASTITGTATFASSGNAISDSGTLAITGATTLTAGAGDVTLADASSTFGTLKITGADVSVLENAAMDLGASTISGTASFNSSGNEITDSDKLVIAGATTLNAGVGNVTLDEAESTFGSVAFAGGTVAITAADALELSGTSTATDLTIKATSGGITDATGASLTVTNNASFDAVDDSAITLDGALSLDSLTFDGGAVTISEAGGMDVTGVNEATTLTLVAPGTASTDSINVNSNSKITANSANLYAAGSVTVGSSAQLTMSEETGLWFSTKYDNGAVSGVYTSSGTISISQSSTIVGGLIIAEYGQQLLNIDSKSRIRVASADQVVDYFNALEPSLEVADQWDATDAGALQASIGLGAITLDTGESANVEVEEEEEK